MIRMQGRSDLAGRLLMIVAALAAFGAGVDAIVSMAGIAPQFLWIESWRALAYVVFAGLFTLVAWRPRSSPLIWELLFLHKISMALIGLLTTSIPAGRHLGAIDLALAMAVASAWVLTSGWKSWLKATTANH